MEISELKAYHERKVKKISALAQDRNFNVTDEHLRLQRFHLGALELIESFEDGHIEDRVLKMELDIKKRAVESMHNLGKTLVAEAKDFRRMMLGNVDGDGLGDHHA